MKRKAEIYKPMKKVTSVPNMRGRKQNLKTKRLCAKKVRQMPINTDFVVLKRLRKSVKID